MSSAADAGSILAFDFGTTIAQQTSDGHFAAIRTLVNEWKPSRLVVGLPLHADGTPHETSARAQRFARQLEGRFGIPVTLFDERFTTQAARSALLEGRVRVRERRTVRDRIAAQIILQAYLDEAPADAGAS